MSHENYDSAGFCTTHCYECVMKDLEIKRLSEKLDDAINIINMAATSLDIVVNNQVGYDDKPHCKNTLSIITLWSARNENR